MQYHEVFNASSMTHTSTATATTTATATATGTGTSNGAGAATTAATTTPKRNYYDVLGINRETSAENVKKAYQKLAFKFHPDRNHGNEERAQLQFQEVYEAYQTISDPLKRAEYDKYGHLKVVTISKTDILNAFSCVQGNTSIFNDFFNTTASFNTRFSSPPPVNPGTKRPRMDAMPTTSLSRSRPGRKGQNVQATLHLTFMESANGCTKELKFSKQVICRHCNGHGFPEASGCDYCQGTGKILQGLNGLPIHSICGICMGEGTTGATCQSCHGEGRIARQHNVTVQVPANMMRGEKKIVEGGGDIGENGVCGDLIINIEVDNHPLFRREGFDVFSEHTVTFAQAALGCKVIAESILGPMEVDIPCGTQPYDTIRVPQKGFLNQNNGVSHRGDMYIKIHVHIPQQLTAHQRNLLQAFLESETLLPTTNNSNDNYLNHNNSDGDHHSDNMRISQENLL